MAGIAKKDNSAKPVDLETLKKDFEVEVAAIRKRLPKNPDRDNLPDEEKNVLRQLYSKAAQLAKRISERATDPEESKKYEENFQVLSDFASRFGSVVKNTIPKTTFDDVKGLDEVKTLVKSFMYMVQNPDILKYYRIEGGFGMLMYGAPGTGKTMFAEAMANALNLPLFIITPADIFKSYVGQSEQAVKQLFQEINACPEGAILFVDECESIFTRRTSDTKDYKSAVTNELLQGINGFGGDGSKRILVGATNRPDMIDPAFLRFKRFSNIIHVTPPDATAVRAIIESKLKDIELKDITIDDIMDLVEENTTSTNSVGGIPVTTGYYSAADLCGIIEEACRNALEFLEKHKMSSPIPLTREMFEKAFDKIKPSISQELLEEYNDFKNKGNDD